MPDDPANPTPAPEPSGNPGSDFKVPEGKVLVDQRELQKMEGFKAFYSKAAEAGFRRAKDFDDYVATLSTPPEKLEKPAANPEDKSNLDVESLKKELLTDLERKSEEKVAWIEHRNAEKAASSVIDTLINDIAGGEADEVEKEVVKSVLSSKIDEARRNSFYPDGHPLADHAFRPLTSEEIAQVAGKVKELYGKIKAKSLAKIGDEARKTTTAAGAPGNPGASDTKETRPASRQETRKEKLQAFFREAYAEGGALT